MDCRVIEYLVYLPVSVLLTVWVASTLFRHGRRFLNDVFHGDEELANSVNHLLVVGFYLINLGYVSLQLKLDIAPDSVGGTIEALAGKVGLVLVVLGVMHFGNLFVFAKLRQQSHRTRTPAPPAPPDQLPRWGTGSPLPQRTEQI